MTVATRSRPNYFVHRDGNVAGILDEGTRKCQHLRRYLAYLLSLSLTLRTIRQLRERYFAPFGPALLKDSVELASSFSLNFTTGIQPSRISKPLAWFADKFGCRRSLWNTLAEN
jgi:hypothetical protein